MSSKVRRNPSFALIATLAACGGPPPVAVVAPEVVAAAPATCKLYASFVESFEFCIARLAPELNTVDEVNRICPLAGGMELDCRWRWATEGVVNGRPTEELLAGCGTFDDCKLTVLDRRPAWTIDQQLTRCAESAGKYSFDCAAHALQRWYATLPTATNIEWLANLQTPFPEQVGNYVAAAIVCDGLPGCLGRDEVVRACEQSLPVYQDDTGRCAVMKEPHVQ